MSENVWFLVWMICFSIIYCAALAWPITMIIIYDIEEKIKKLFKKNV